MKRQPVATADGGRDRAVDIAGASGNGTNDGNPFNPSMGTGGLAAGSGGAGGASAGGGTIGSGGAGATTGSMQSGGTPGAGGSASSGTRTGTSGFVTGGAIVGGRGDGGIIALGGRVSSGGFLGSGGWPGTAGSFGTGGWLGSGGSFSGGGSPGTGGALLGGAIGTGGGGLGGASGLGGATVLTCGNGALDPGEECDMGAENQDRPAFLVTQPSLSFAAIPLVRGDSSVEFYSYNSASAHTGLEDVETSRIMLHLYPPALTLALVFIHGVDEDSTGLEQPDGQVVMELSGLPQTTIVDVSDDKNELVMTSETTALGFWILYGNNSDGGSISGLPFPGDWTITIQPSNVSGISTWTWVQSDVSFLPLDLSQSMTIEAHDSPSQCRTNCTIPRCGDGVLDGGEICDPGVATGATCSSDCMSFE